MTNSEVQVKSEVQMFGSKGQLPSSLEQNLTTTSPCYLSVCLESGGWLWSALHAVEIDWLNSKCWKLVFRAFPFMGMFD